MLSTSLLMRYQILAADWHYAAREGSEDGYFWCRGAPDEAFHPSSVQCCSSDIAFFLYQTLK